MKRRCQVIAALALALDLGTASAQPIQVGGLVVGPGDEVVAGVRVRLETYGAPYDRALRRLAGLSGSGETVAETTPDATGLFRLEASHAGVWRVLVEATGYRTMEYRLRPLCEPRDLPALELEPTVAVEVRAIDAARRPVAAAVALYDRKGGRHWRRRFQIDHTREDGVARFERAGAEQVRYVALPLDPSSGLVRTHSDAEDGKIVLAYGVPGILFVHDAANAPVANAVVHQGGDLLPLGTTDARGFLAIAHARDNLKVWALAADGASGLFEIDLSPGVASVRLEPAERRRGRVVEEGSGEPIAGALVLPPYSRDGRSDARGQFSIDVPVIGAGKTWNATAAGYGGVWKRFEGEMPESLDFQLARAAVLRGSVIGVEGRPVPGGDVRADPLARADYQIVGQFPQPPGEARARTDGDGRFAIYGLAPGASYEVVAEREGYAPGRAEIYALGPASPALRLVLGRGLRASGRVIGDDERPVAGAVVRLLRSPPGKRAKTYRGESFRRDRRESRIPPTDAEGRFTAVDLDAGRYDLEVKADGYAVAKIPGVEVLPVADDGGETDLGTFVLERGVTIAGRVVDADGHGVAGAKVSSRAVEEHVSRYEMETRADGSFVLVDLRAGEERVVEVDLEGFAPSAVLAVARREDETEPLRIVLQPPGTISGRVVDGDGKPLAGASIWALPAESSLLRYRAAKVVETDAGGRFEVGGIPTGAVNLRVWAEGHQWEVLPGLSAPPGGELTGVEVALKRGVSIRGRVTRTDGTPVAVDVSAEILEGSPDDVGGGASTRADGRYELPSLPPGLIRVYVRNRNVERIIDGRRGGVFTVDLVLAAGAEVSGHVVDETGRGLAGVLLKLIPVESPTSYLDEKGPRSDAEGAFIVSGVQPGTYRLYGRKNGFATAWSEVHVADGPVAGVRLVMRRGVSLSGTVLGLEAAEIAELSIAAHGSPIPDSGGTGDSLGDLTQHGSVDHDGSYRIPGLAPGYWHVSASLPGQAFREDVVVAEGDTEIHRDLDFSSLSTLRGTLLVSRPGEPLAPAPGFEVRASSSAGSSQDRTDAAGRFRLKGIRQEAGLHLTLRLGWSSYSRQIDLAGPGELDLELHLAKLRGQVRDASTLLPVPNARSTLETVSGTTSLWHYSTRSFTDVQGRFELGGIPTARWRLAVSKPGYAQESVEVDLSSPIDLDGLEILLVPSEGITFQAVDEGGEVPQQLMVTVFRPDGGTVLTRLLQPDEQGMFRLSAVPRGAGQLTLLSFEDRSVATTAFTSSGDLGRLVLRRGGAAKLRVPELEGREVVAWIRAVGGDGQPFYYPAPPSFRDAGRIEVGSWPMREGVGHVSPLAPGLWSFTVTAEDGRTWSAQANVLTGETVEVVLR